MNNQEFLIATGATDKEAQQNCLAAMEKYGENHWWEHDADPRAFAYYQLHEKLWLDSTRSLRDLTEALELLLSRPILLIEWGNRDALRQEAQRAWDYQVGCTSDTERVERLEAVIEDAQKRGIRVFRV